MQFRGHGEGCSVGDVEPCPDPVVPQSGFQWSSDIDGFIGVGDPSTDSLIVGRHAITLLIVCTGCRGEVMEDRITIHVNPRP